jgi:RNA recognition motif-containing protein
MLEIDNQRLCHENDQLKQTIRSQSNPIEHVMSNERQTHHHSSFVHRLQASNVIVRHTITCCSTNSQYFVSLIKQHQSKSTQVDCLPKMKSIEHDIDFYKRRVHQQVDESHASFMLT